MDEYGDSPDTIAKEVFAQMKEKLPDLTNMQVVAFCIEYLAGQAITDMPFIEDEVKALARLYYTAHYYTIWRTLDQEKMDEVVTKFGLLRDSQKPSLKLEPKDPTQISEP